MIEAVVFDLDGTLLDTLEDLKEAVNVALRTFDMPERTLNEIREFVGNGVKKLMIRAVPDGEKNPDFEGAFLKFKEYYALHSNDKTEPYPGIIELLTQLKYQGIKMAIVSNKIDFAVKDLSRIYFADYMDAAIGDTDGIQRKPAPDTVYKALDELGVRRENAIYVGDSDVDILTAQNSGLDCISVTWGFRDREFLILNGAETLVDSPTEILSYIRDKF